jgi:hypothetical protein
MPALNLRTQPNPEASAISFMGSLVSSISFFENLWAEGALAEGIMEDGLGRAEKILLGERILLRQ